MMKEIEEIGFIWPSDIDRAENDDLNRVCEFAEQLWDICVDTNQENGDLHKKLYNTEEDLQCAKEDIAELKAQLLQRVPERSPIGWVWEAYGEINFTESPHRRDVLEDDGAVLCPVYTAPQPPAPVRSINEIKAEAVREFAEEFRSVGGQDASPFRQELYIRANLYADTLSPQEQRGG